jgi:hypothetical protein
MTTNTASENERPARKISFNSRVTVVLIPERREIKDAGCDLWWARNDYSTFQQSAQSEIRLYAMYENINCKEAKSMLYQPSENDLAHSNEREELDEGWDLALDAPSKDGDESEETEASFSPIMLRHVDSVTLLSDHDKHSPPRSPVKSASSIKLSPTKSKQSSEDDLHRYVSLCVPSKEYESLAEKECSHSRRRQSARIDQSSGFVVACGIFSFTLPIIGYYLMHYSN